MSTDPRVDAYIAAKAEFARPILQHIRARVHAACPDVEESIKWSMPFFLYRGRPFANMAAFKAHACFGFWNRQGMATGREGEAMGQFGRLTGISDLPSEAEFEALIRDAAASADAGEGAKRGHKIPRPDADVPPELSAALAGDAAANATFTAFSPGCRREYCEWIADARRPETKARRVAEAIVWMREGKKRNWKYEAR